MLWTPTKVLSSSRSATSASNHVPSAEEEKKEEKGRSTASKKMNK
jgi:hypothetical protein